MRGQAGAHKTMVLTAVAYNLTKLRRYRPQQQLSAAVALPRPLPAPDTRFCLRRHRAGRQTGALVKQPPRRGAS